jgi:hypothetical protein
MHYYYYYSYLRLNSLEWHSLSRSRNVCALFFFSFLFRTSQQLGLFDSIPFVRCDVNILLQLWPPPPSHFAPRENMCKSRRRVESSPEAVGIVDHLDFVTRYFGRWGLLPRVWALHHLDWPPQFPFSFCSSFFLFFSGSFWGARPRDGIQFNNSEWWPRDSGWRKQSGAATL